MTPYRAAREAFEQYAGRVVNADEMETRNRYLTEGTSTRVLQQQLARWAAIQFGARDVHVDALGMTEEFGELTEELAPLFELAASTMRAATSVGKISHAVLKHLQKIRGMREDDVFREKVADAIADIMIFATQMCTLLRIDFGTLYDRTVVEVVKRDWKKHPHDGGQP